MTLIHPGWVELAGLFGIILSALASLLFAFNQTNLSEKIQRGWHTLRFGYDAINALEEVMETEGKISSGQGFQQLRKILAQEKTISEFGLQHEPGELISEIGYETYNHVNGHHLYIIGPNGSEDNQTIIVEELSKEIEDHVKVRRELWEDRIILIIWGFMLAGFALQGVSYFFRHFIVW
jgi:hypothetical protein